VGEQLEVGVDVRILSATHKKSVGLVAEESFGKTFLSRERHRAARAFARERREDVPELRGGHLRRLGRRMKTTPPIARKDALAAFESYDFPR